MSNFMGVSILTLLHDDMKFQVRDVMSDPERMEIQKVIGRGIWSGTTLSLIIILSCVLFELVFGTLDYYC